MVFLHIHKAQALPGLAVDSVHIVIDREFPNFPESGDALDEFKRDGVTLADTLCDSLPGGVLDVLTGELLRRKATSLVVPRDQ